MIRAVLVSLLGLFMANAYAVTVSPKLTVLNSTGGIVTGLTLLSGGVPARCQLNNPGKRFAAQTTTDTYVASVVDCSNITAVSYRVELPGIGSRETGSCEFNPSLDVASNAVSAVTLSITDDGCSVSL